jgi:hypothetical protein
MADREQSTFRNVEFTPARLVDVCGDAPPNTVVLGGTELTMIEEEDNGSAASSDEEPVQLSGLPDGTVTSTTARKPFDDMRATSIRSATECDIKWGKKKKNGELSNPDHVLKWKIHCDSDRPSIGETPSLAKTTDVVGD